MADRIIISTQWLDSCSKDLRAVQNALNDAGRSLRNVDLSHQAGGDKSVTFATRSLRCGASISGDEVSAVVRSAGSGINALADDISKLVSAIASNVEQFSSAEASLTALANGLVYDVTLSVYNSGGVTYAKYDIRFSAKEIIDKNREQWNSQNRFSGTEYDQQIRDGLRDLLVYDARFRKSRWDSLETDAEREKFIRELIDELQRIYQTDINGGVHFVRNSDFPEGQDYVDITINGDVTRYYRSFNGGYNGSVDAIMLRLYNNDGSPKSYEDIIDTLCHENRHNLQNEIINSTDLDKYDGVNGEDYDDIVAARDAWLENQRNYKDGVLTDEERATRSQEVYDEMNWIQRRIWNQEAREEQAGFDEYEDYAEQQNEVDARYTGEYARDLVKEQRSQERAEKIDAAVEEVRKKAEYIRDKAKTYIDMSRRGWENVMNNV